MNTAQFMHDPVQTAKAAKLLYVSDTIPGINRKKAGDQFTYTNAKGEPIDDEDTLIRIRSMALPPAWERVWISPKSNSHLQATGIDSKNRKQYRYHSQLQRPGAGDRLQ